MKKETVTMMGVLWALGVLAASEAPGRFVLPAEMRKAAPADKLALVEAALASSPTNAALQGRRVNLLAKEGRFDDATAAMNGIPDFKKNTLRATIQAEQGDAAGAIATLRAQVNAATNRQSLFLALRMASIYQTGKVNERTPKVGGKLQPVKAVPAESVWPLVIGVCETCKLGTNQLHVAKSMLAKLKLAEVSGDITTDDLARAAKGIFNGLPATPAAAEVLSEAKLLYDLNKGKGGASLGPKIGDGQAAAVQLEAVDLVDRRMAVAAVRRPVAGSAFGRLLQRDKSLEARERWATSVQGAIAEMR